MVSHGCTPRHPEPAFYYWRLILSELSKVLSALSFALDCTQMQQKGIQIVQLRRALDELKNATVHLLICSMHSSFVAIDPSQPNSKLCKLFSLATRTQLPFTHFPSCALHFKHPLQQICAAAFSPCNNRHRSWNPTVLG